MQHTTTALAFPEPPAGFRPTPYGDVPEGIAGFAKTLTIRPSRLVDGWYGVYDRFGRRVGSVNRTDLVPPFAAEYLSRGIA